MEENIKTNIKKIKNRVYYKNMKDTYNGMVLFQDALAQLRGMSSGVSRVGESYETLQSRARELEKKVCVLII